MKYFTAKLWKDINSPVRSIRDKAHRQWKRNVALYHKQFTNILPKLSRKARKYFEKIRLHDGEIILFSMGDILLFSKQCYRVRSNFAEMKILHPELNGIYTLCYSKIRSYKIEYSTNPPISLESDSYILGCWGYDELLMTKDKWLRHEILFDTGATVAIEFKNFSYKIKRFKSKKDELKEIKQITSRTT